MTEKTPVERVLYTTEEVASALGIGSTKVKELIRTGELRSVKIGRLRRILRTSVNDYAVTLDLEQNGLPE